MLRIECSNYHIKIDLKLTDSISCKNFLQILLKISCQAKLEIKNLPPDGNLGHWNILPSRTRSAGLLLERKITTTTTTTTATAAATTTAATTSAALYFGGSRPFQRIAAQSKHLKEDKKEDFLQSNSSSSKVV